MTIEINQRLYDDFVSWAKANNMSDNNIDKYVERAFREKFMLDKYGDLNEKVHNANIKSANEPNNEPINELNHEPIQPKNEYINEDINEYINEDVNTSEQINEPINEQINEQIKKPEKPKRKTKVIQSK